VIGTAIRFWPLSGGVDRRVFWSFGLTSAAGGVIGALIQSRASNRWLNVVFGVLLLFAAVSELIGLARRMRFRGPVAWIAGAVSGLLGGLVGNQGGLRSAALLGFGLSKHSFVATATAIGLVVDGARMPVYLMMQARELADMVTWLALAALGVTVGTVLGSRVLARIPEVWFHRVVALVLAVLGGAMLWRGFAAGWASAANHSGQVYSDLEMRQMMRGFVGMKWQTRGARLAPVLLGVAVTLGVADAQEPPNELVKAIQSGGYVLVMRHASSPREAPSKEVANADNTRLERQLDEAGRRGATAMGEAIRALRIPIGIVLTSPTYRAMETVRLARLDSPTTVTELGDGGQSMQGITEAQAGWLRRKVTEVSRSGNTILVTHQPNLSRAFPDWGSTLADGETAVIRPDGRGGITVAGRIRIEDWRRLR
jgi:uncharacterized protein